VQKFYAEPLNYLHVRKQPGSLTRGLLQAGNRTLTCALGRSGIGIKSGEGDGVTPRGEFDILYAMVRPDRTRLRPLQFDVHEITKTDGWCDAAGERNYNRPVQLPYPHSHERLSRDDHLYDVVLVMDYNISQRMSVGGSAIFFHLAHDDYRPTEGCVALSARDMTWLMPRISPATRMIIE